MHKFFFCVLLIMFLFACSSAKKYDEKLNLLIGKDEQAVLGEFGKPSSQKIIGKNSKILTYTRAEKMYVPSEFYEYDTTPFPGAYDTYYPFASIYDYNPMQQYLGIEVTRNCQTSFLIENDKVKSWKHSGNDCVAR